MTEYLVESTQILGVFCVHFRSGLVGQRSHDWLVRRHESERPPQPLKVKHEHEMGASRGRSHQQWCAMMPHNCTFCLYYVWTCAEANPDIVSARGFHLQFSLSPALFKTLQEDWGGSVSQSCTVDVINCVAMHCTQVFVLKKTTKTTELNWHFLCLSS